MEDAVSVHMHLNDRDELVRFSRTGKYAYEQASIAWLLSTYIRRHSGTASSRISEELPVVTCHVDDDEIDTEADLQRAQEFVTERAGQ